MTNNRPEVRADLALRPGYHSPQIDVDVRLNTNEAPTALPDAFEAALKEEMSSIEWNRYPDRGARRLREAIAERYDRRPEEVFVANGSNEVLQTVLLTFGGHGRTAAIFEPTYAMHGQISKTTATTVVEGNRADDFRNPCTQLSRRSCTGTSAHSAIISGGGPVPSITTNFSTVSGYRPA